MPTAHTYTDSAHGVVSSRPQVEPGNSSACTCAARSAALVPAATVRLPRPALAPPSSSLTVRVNAATPATGVTA